MAMGKITYISTFIITMKTKFVLLAYILISVSCSMQREFVKTNKTCLFNDSIFEIQKEEMVFDGAKYDSILSKKGAFYDDSKKYIKRIQSKKIWLTDRDNNLIKKIKYNSSNDIKHVYFYLKNSTSTKIGTEYFFNKNGEITETIDHEKGYNICWAEAISILRKIARKEIKKYKIDEFILNRIDIKEFPEEKPKWIISMKGSEEYNDLYRKTYEIDGVTGTLIRKYEIHIIPETP